MSAAKVIPLRAPTAADLSDAGLLASAAVDSAAVAVLFERHHRALYGFLSRLLGRDDPEVDDLVQTTFVEAIRGRARYQGAASVRTWIFGIAANLVRHHIRSAQRRRAAYAALTGGAERTRPDDSAERGELLERLARALATLPHDLRVTYLLCAVEEIPGVEVAATLGVPEGTVWRRLHEARRLLRAALEGRGP